MIYLNEKYARVSFNKDVPCISVTWLGYANNEQSQLTLNTVIDAMIDVNVYNCIADVRNMKVITPEMQKWNYEVWMPRAVKAGYSALGLVQSSDFFNQTSVNNIIQEYKKDYGDDFKINIFKTVEDAENWIRSFNL